MKTIKSYITENKENTENKYLKEQASKLVNYLKFTKSDVKDEVDFYYECEYEAEKNDTIYHIFYGIVDILNHKYHMNSINTVFNKLIVSVI